MAKRTKVGFVKEKEKEITMFREEVTSTLACFHKGPLSWSNRNFDVLIFWLVALDFSLFLEITRE